MGFVFLAWSLFCSAAAAGASPSGGGLENAVRELSAQVAERPAALPRLFDKSLFRSISAAELEKALLGVYRDNGAVTAVVFVSSDTEFSGHFLLETDRGRRVPVAISLSPETGRINGVFFGRAYEKDLALYKTRLALRSLPGKTGLLALRLGSKPEVIEALNENAYFAAGPAFRLYVFGALLEAKLPWTKVFRPKVPGGPPRAARALAARMISGGDNAAADALIDALGRGKVEAALPALGYSSPVRLRPFLKASEMSRLKADSAAALKFLSLPAEEKYGFLEELRAAPGAAAGSSQSPFGTAKIEWPVTPADLCRAMRYFAVRNDAEALAILGANKGLVPPAGLFSYAGYAGGAEQGMISMTWLLENKKKEWFCLSGSWNNEAENPDEGEFAEIMRGALNSLAAN